MELGNHRDVDLAMDVDGDLAEDDPEALESDDEDAIDEELGIDVNGTESDYFLDYFLAGPNVPISPHAYRTAVLPVT